MYEKRRRFESRYRTWEEIRISRPSAPHEAVEVLSMKDYDARMHDLRERDAYRRLTARPMRSYVDRSGQRWA